MSTTVKATPKVGTKGFQLKAVLPTKDCLDEAIASNGFCSPRKCWHFVAINKLMDRLEPGTKHHVRVDAGHIKLNYKGWRYVADTPRHVKRSLMLFDKKRYNEVYVRPYTLHFRRTTKILPYTKERQKQIDAAREKRIVEGRDNYQSPPVSLRKRVEGFSSIV